MLVPNRRFELGWEADGGGLTPMERQHLLSAALAALGLLCLVAPWGVSASRAAEMCSSPTPQLDEEEIAFVALLNEYRAARGVEPLMTSATLSAAADWHAHDLGGGDTFSHHDSLGRDPTQRARDCGYPAGAGENIAGGTRLDTARAALTIWQGSSPHDSNMLTAGYRVIGVARAYYPEAMYGWYWVANFGRELAETTQTDDHASPEPSPALKPLWVNDPDYGSGGGGFYWDPLSGQVWTHERGWHSFGPEPDRCQLSPLWVNDPPYRNAGGGFYWDPASGLVWTAERGWHSFSRPLN